MNDYLPLLDLPLHLGLFLLALVCAMLFALTFGGWRPYTSLLFKDMRQLLLRDMKNPKIAFGGPLGLMRHMLRLAIVLIIVGLLAKVLKLILENF